MVEWGENRQGFHTSLERNVRRLQGYKLAEKFARLLSNRIQCNPQVLGARALHVLQCSITVGLRDVPFGRSSSSAFRLTGTAYGSKKLLIVQMSCVKFRYGARCGHEPII